MMRFLLAGIAVFALNLFPFTSAVEWTPADFDWDSLRCNDTVPSGLWMYKHAAPETTDLSLLSADHATSVDAVGMQRISVSSALGFAWRAAGIAALGPTLAGTIDSCKQTVNKEAGVGPCLKGVFGTVVSFGGAASASKDIGHALGQLVLPHRFLPDGTVDLEMNIIPYNKRDLATAQNAHEDFVRRQLRSLSSKEPEFLGYAQDDHRLAKKDFGLHPRVPMFQFDHFKHGSMEITTRNTLNGTYITAAYAGHPTHLLGRRQINDLKQRMKRDEVYDHELFKTGVLEARFDGDASEADPASIEPEAGKLFDTFEPEVECFMSDGYKGGNVLDVQMYDKTNKATFGFGSIGLFENDEDAHAIEDMEPEGMPLSQCN